MRREQNRWRLFRTGLIILNIVAYCFIGKSYAGQDFKIIDSSNRGITVELAPKIERIDTVRQNGENYYKIYIAHASLTGNPGEPLIPVRVMNIGIPLRADVNVSIVSVASREIEGKLVAAPQINQSGSLEFDKRSAGYQSSKFFPSQIVTTESLGFIRDQRVVKIDVFPVQFAGRLERIKLVNNIVIRIDFTGDVRTPVQNKLGRNDDEFYRGLVINYSQSRRWLKKHIPSLKRTNTLLQNENWYKISIRQEGIYKISGSDLSAVGISTTSINPASIRIFNNGGRELPRSLNAARPDSLIENAIRAIDQNNNKIFDDADYILFYGKAVNNWEAHPDSANFYQHYLNHYIHDNIYWLTWTDNGSGKRMETNPSTSVPGAEIAPDFWGLYFDEDEINNLFSSGYHWFGRLITGNSQQGYSVYLPDPANRENNVFFRFRCLGVTRGSHSFTVYLNNQLLTNISFSGSYRLETHEVTGTIQLAADGYNSLKLKYNNNSPEDKAYVDWYEIQYRKQFIAEDNYLIFNQSARGAYKYQIANFPNDNIEVYEITDWANAKRITNAEIASGSVTFFTEDNGLNRRKFIALTPEAYSHPEKIEQAVFNDIRNSITGADFIIITHDDFYDAIMPLKQHREIHDTLATAVIKISDIYNEFSCGLLDPVAIRDFIKYAFDNWNPAPKYVLLCGDGDYDYKNIVNNLDKNWLPPFETTELSNTSNRTMDEFFVLVSGDDSNPDLAIGRFPVQTFEETENVVEKIIEYETAPYWNPSQTHLLEDWRNVVTMVGDDEYHDSNSRNEVMHTRDADYIMENYVPDSFNKDKIYLIEYPAIKEPSTSGFRKPAATEALLKRINDGTLVLNYIGHGAPDIWADERVLLESRDFELIQNQSRLPLWVAATCDFGRFDDPMEQGMAEKLFVAKGRGGIAFMTSARLAYATDNTALNRKFYEKLFKNNYSVSERMGVALTQAKIDNYSSTNDQKYHLFGDPTMRLAAPQFGARITSIQPDTLKALSEISVTGQIMKENRAWNNFEGKALLKIFDSKIGKIYTTEFGSQISYVAAGKTIFRGTIQIDDGQFEARFIVPKDITYGGKYGRFSIYFANEQVHGSGYRDYIPVGGTAVLQDAEGPVIRIGFEGQNFVDGNLVSQNSKLEVEIADSVSGVNIAGDIGHNVTMVIDENESNEIILTDQFNYYEGNFKAGKVLYDFSTYNAAQKDKDKNIIEQNGLEPGEHTIRVKAWDNFNNSSISSVRFTVISNNSLGISNVYNYPNPFASATTFLFSISQPSRVQIKIYTVSGRLISTLKNLPGEAGMNQYDWDGRDKDGDVLANGVYLYKIMATVRQQDKTLKDEYIGKLVIAR